MAMTFTIKDVTIIEITTALQIKGALWSFVVNKQKLCLHCIYSVSYQNALCISLRCNKCVECISLLIKHS